MKYFTGIDVSLRFVSMCVIDEAGVVQYEKKVPAEVDRIVTSLRRFSSEIKKVGLEAGTLTQYLTYGLQQAGYEVICLEARQTAATLAAMRNKTDRNDARGLAQILRSGWYRRVHVKSLESHQVRALLASRKAILTKCVDLENELRGLLKIFGVRLASRVGHGGFDTTVRSAITADPVLARALVPLLDARTVLYKTYLKLDNAVKAVVRSDPICQRLMTVRCSLLDERESADQIRQRADRYARNRKILERAHRVNTVVGVLGYSELAERVSLDAPAASVAGNRATAARRCH